LKAKIFKILKYIGFIFLILLLGTFTLISTSWFQNYVADKAAIHLSKEIGTKISIDKIKLNWNGTVDVLDAYVADQNDDTLFYIQKINATYGAFNNKERLVLLDYLSLENVVVNFVQHEGESDFNYEFFFDYFAPKKKRTGPPIIWTINFANLKLKNASFLYQIEGKAPPTDRTFDENYMHYQDINAEFDQFQIIDDSLDFHAKYLNCIERSGLKIKNMTSSCTIHWKGMSFDNLNLETENSVLKDKLYFQYESWRSYSDFINAVYINTDLKESVISAKDIAFFTNNLKGINYQATISGNASGTIASFDAEDVKIKALANTSLQGDFSLSGLPNFKNTFMDFNIKQLLMGQRDLEELVGKGKLPDNIKLLGGLNYKGNLTGFSKDFVSDGNLRTNLGTLTTDINLKLNDQLNNGSYSGLLQSESFELGEFLDIPDLGTIAVNAKLEGKGFKTSDVDLGIDGKLDRIEFKNYAYTVTRVEGSLTPNFFTGLAIIKDNNVDLEFDGEVDFTGEEPKLNFNAEVRHANLKALNIDSSDHFAAKMSLDMVGFDIDNFNGSARIDSLEYKRVNQPLQKVNFINLNAYSKNKTRNIILESDLINAEVRGDFILKELVHTGEKMLHDLLPLYFEKEKDTIAKQEFIFRIDFLQPEIITSLFAPDVIISKGWIKGEFKSESDKLRIKLKNDRLGYQNFYLKGLDLDATKEPGSPMFFDLKSADLMIDSLAFSSDISFNGSAFNNSISYKLKASERDNRHALSTSGELSFDTTIIDLIIGESDIFLLNEKWYLDSLAYVSYSEEKLTIQNFVLQQDKQLLRANGTIGRSEDNSLKINTQRFKLSTLNNVIESEEIKLFGLANGDINISNFFNTPYITADLTIQDLALNKDTIGDLSVKSIFINESKALDIEAKVERGLLNGLLIDGILDPFDKSENFAINMNLPASDIAVMENFTKGLISDISGEVKASLKLRGTYANPELTGKVDLINTKLKVDYLNTYYKAHTTVNIAPDGFYFNRFKVKDINDNFGYAYGNIKHEKFSNFLLDIKVNELKDFLALNTAKGDNELFYGKISVDGNMTVKGPIEEGVDMYIDATTKKGTRFYLPIDDSEGIANSSFISFKKEKAYTQTNIKSGIPGIHFLQINASITKEAEIEIIFDEQLGDKITGYGRGKLTMELDDEGDFYLKGAVEIENGEYLFTAFDVINKPFVINQGSRIEWTGDPYKAKVDITASFTQTASTKNLIASQVKDNNDNYVYPEIQTINYLYLKGNLFSPDIKFGLDVPSTNSLNSNNTNISSAINRIKNDPEELNRQVFSLLIFSQFLPPSFLTSEQNSFDATSGLSTSVSDLISSQVGNWLSAIDDKWKVNVDYRTGTSTQKEEFILDLGRKFINDRLEIIASYNTAVTNTPNFDVQYSLTKDGRLKVKAYSKSNLNIVSNSNSTTQGVGFFFKKEFDRRRKRRIRRLKERAKNN